MKISIKTDTLLAFLTFASQGRSGHPTGVLHLHKTAIGSLMIAATDGRSIIMHRFGTAPDGWTKDRTIPYEVVKAVRDAKTYRDAAEIKFTDTTVSVNLGSLTFTERHSWQDFNLPWEKVMPDLIGEPRTIAGFGYAEHHLSSWIFQRILNAWKQLREDDEGEGPQKELIVKRSGIGFAIREFPGADFCAVVMPYKLQAPADLDPLPEWAMHSVSLKAEEPAQ
jgi:hypothetical protein